MTKPDITKLVQLPDFPNYYADIKEGLIYSYKFHSHSKRSLMLLRGVKQRDKRRSRYINITGDDGRFVRSVSIAKLIASATYGVSIDRLPVDVVIIWNEERKKLETTTYGECSDRGWKMRRENITKNRIKTIDDTIHELNLLKEFYSGNELPLTTYLYGKKEELINVLRNRYGLHIRREALVHGIDIAFDRLFSYREKTAGNIYNVSEWVVKSAKGLILLNKRRDAMNQLYDTTK